MLIKVCYNIDMSKVLIIGNVLKDVYLKLDSRKNTFETDENGIDWLELGFNGDAHSFFRRTSVYGGAAVSLSVLNSFKVDAAILNSTTEMKAGEISWSNDPADYRYIFSHNNKVTYFVPSTRKPTNWSMPSSMQGTPEWILVDRSTAISARLVDELRNFLKFSPSTKLAVHAEKHATPDGRRLMEMADLLFIEDEPAVHKEEKIVDKIELDQPNTQLVCHISPRKIYFGDAEESWDLDRTDMMTHLTVYSTIVATVLSVVVAGGSPAEAILLARLNAEHATLEGSLSLEKLRELAQSEQAKRNDLKLIARSIMASGKGVLAIDESPKSLTKRFEKFKLKNNLQNRREFYKMLVTTPNLKESISAVILSENNAKQKLNHGQNILEYLTDHGIIAGLKADKGLMELADSDETHTLGKDGLAVRLRSAYETGFRFAKWRAAFKIGKNKPDFFVLQQNADELAHFAKECQLVGLIPVVETDISAEGDFPIERSAEVMARVLSTVFEKLAERHVDLSGCLLKCNMITAGNRAEVPATPNEVGMATAAILQHAVPKYLAGILLLSGGQEPKQATKNLTAILQNSPFPWPVSFAFSRALEEPVLATWKGEPENIKAAQAALERHLLANADALHYGKTEPRLADTSGKINVLDLS